MILCIPDCFAVVEPFHTKYYGKRLGEFERRGSSLLTNHGVRGTVHVADETTIIIEGFAYDGQAPGNKYVTTKGTLFMSAFENLEM